MIQTRKQFVIQYRLKFLDAGWCDFPAFEPFSERTEAETTFKGFARSGKQEYRIVERDITDKPLEI